MEIYLVIVIGIVIAVIILMKRISTLSYSSYAQHIILEFKHLSPYIYNLDLLREVLLSWNKDIIEFNDNLIIWEEPKYPELIFSCSDCNMLPNEKGCMQLNVYGLNTSQKGKVKHLSLAGFSYIVTLQDGNIIERKYSTKRREGGSDIFSTERRLSQENGKIIQTTDSIKLGKEFSSSDNIVCVDDKV